MADTTDSKKRKLEAALSSARATVALLEAELEDVNAGDDPLLSLEDAAAKRNCSPWTLRGWTKTGRLPAVRGSRSKLLVRLSDVDAALEAQPVVPRLRKAPADEAPTEDEDLLDELVSRGDVVAKGGKR